MTASDGASVPVQGSRAPALETPHRRHATQLGRLDTLIAIVALLVVLGALVWLAAPFTFAGLGSADDAFFASISFAETRRYVAQVLSSYDRYRALTPRSTSHTGSNGTAGGAARAR